MKATEVIWISTMEGTIGIILAKNGEGENVVLVKKGIAFNSEADDIRDALDWGGKLNLIDAEKIYNHLKK